MNLSELCCQILKKFTGNCHPASLLCVPWCIASSVEFVFQVEKGGEDVFFVSQVGRGAVAVADGVGSWSSDGVDPALYPQFLLKHAQEAYERKNGDMSALDCMAHGQYRAKTRGTCTACIATMQDEGTLQVANMGDSGFRLIRDGKIVEASKVQALFLYYLQTPFMGS